MSHMLREIHEQPHSVAAALDSEQRNAERLADGVRARQIQSIVVAARGTSDNAATYAKYLFEIITGIPVALAAPSVYTLYGASLQLKNSLVLGISQSGQGTDVVEVLARSRASGALTACITNSPESPITDVSEHVLLCHAGSEQAVAATKTYTTSLAVAALLACSIAGDSRLLTDLRRAPGEMLAVLGQLEGLRPLVERYRFMRECAVIARGVNQATALETALKLTETCYIAAKAYSGADFLHGPIATVEPGFPCLLFAPAGPAFGHMFDLANNIRARGGELLVVSSEKEMLGLAATAVPLNSDLDELFSPLLYVLPGQLLACHLAEMRGGEPDHPRGLSKVTRTV